jgi:hypothetical protein
MTSRKQKLKDLMKNRTTVEEGLTVRQIFNEIYSDVFEEYCDKKDDTGQPMLEICSMERNDT